MQNTRHVDARLIAQKLIEQCKNGTLTTRAADEFISGLKAAVEVDTLDRDLRALVAMRAERRA